MWALELEHRPVDAGKLHRVMPDAHNHWLSRPRCRGGARCAVDEWPHSASLQYQSGTPRNYLPTMSVTCYVQWWEVGHDTE